MSVFANIMSAARGPRGHLARDTCGTSAVEFAIVAPVFFLMLFALIQLSLAFFHGTTIQWAVERAVRTAMIDPDITLEEIRTLTEENLSAIGTPDIALTYVVDTSGVMPLARVTANYDVQVELPFVSGFTIPFSVETYVPLPP